MTISPQLVSMKTYGLVLAIALSPAVMQQSISCNPGTGDATLSALEMEAMGENHISAFDPDQLAYNVELPLGADTAIVRAYSTDPGSQVSYNLSVNNYAGTLDTIDYGYFPTGGGEVTLNGLLPEGRSLLGIHVAAPGGARAVYAIAIQVGCSNCDDANGCTTDVCDASVEVCVHTAEPDDTFCDYGGDLGICMSGLCEKGFPCTEQGIREAIAWGGGPHTFACSGPTTVVTQAEIIIDNDVILDGKGNLTVDANQAHRVFSIPEGVTAELIGFAVTGGSTAEDGGGILNAGTFTLTSSTVTENWAFFGGGIGNLETGTLTVVASTVSENTAILAAGIRTAGTAEVIDTTISANNALNHGGGVRVATGGALTLSGSVVQGNSAVSIAGGVGSEPDSVVAVNNTTILGNEAGVAGGGIQNAGTLTVSESSVLQNVALLGYGGGLWNETPANATVTNSTVSENSAGALGGGVDNFGSMTLVDSTFSGNVSRDGGAGIFNEFAGTLTIQSCTVSGNATTEGAGAGILHVHSGSVTLMDSTVTGNESPSIGGGIAIGTTSELTIIDSIVSNNSATDGGGIWGAGESSLTMTGSTVSDNAAVWQGGGIVNNGTLTLTNTNVSGNQAGGGGAGMFTTGTVTLESVTIADNSADTGGGIMNLGALSVTDTTVSGNTSVGEAGGLVNYPDASATLIRTTIEGNSVTSGWGGGIANFGTISLTEANVTGNQARWDGGGILNYQATLTLTNSAVSQNTADNLGGGVMNEGTMTLIGGTIFGNSTTQGEGGGIVNDDLGMLVVDDTTISDNTSNISGGGILNFGYAELNNCELSRNVALDWGGGVATLGTLFMSNTTVSENTAHGGGGGMGTSGDTTVTGSTIARNQPPGISNAGGLLTLTNTLIEGDCGGGTFVSGGHNIESPGDTCGFDQPTDQVNVLDPMLGALANNGGPTRTHALLPGSVAIDVIPGPECLLTEDQRGEPRPEPGGTDCDIGAFEVQP